MFYLCSIPLVLSQSTTKESLSHSSFLPIRYLYTLMRSHLNLLFSRVDSLSSPSLYSHEKCSSPLFIFVALHCTLHGLGSQEWDAVFQISLGFPNPITAISDNNSVFLPGSPTYFHLLYTYFYSLSSIRMSLLIHTGFLLFMLDFLFIRMDHVKHWNTLPQEVVE